MRTRLILRCGLGLVFLIFGAGKFRGDEWADTMRSMEFFSYLPWSVDASIVAVGAIEVLTGIALIAGRYTRFFAGLAAAQLSAILILLYCYGIREVRDIGLLAMAWALFLDGQKSPGPQP